MPLSSVLIGRNEELSLLVQALDAARLSSGGLCLIAGEAGIGKSRLAREIAAEAEGRGMSVLWGRAVHAETPAPFRPLAEALLSHLRGGVPADLPELAPFRSALGRLVPEWRETEQRVDDSVVVLSEGIARLLRALAAGRGCLLVLDDLHWADPETLAIVEYLADNLRHEPVLCLVTLRTEEPSRALDLAQSLQARRATPILTLSRLDARAVSHMVESCLDSTQVPSELTAFLHERSEGVPFIVEELLAATLDAGALLVEGDQCAVSGSLMPTVPPTFAATVQRRLRLLTGHGRGVIAAAAVLGRYFDWRLLAAITGVDDGSLLDALQTAVELQLIVAGSASFHFRHALTRDAVLDALLPPEREDLARRALDVLRTVHPDLEGELCQLAGELAEMAGERQQAALLLLDAGRRALGAGALATAEAALERARRVDAIETALLTDILETLTEVLSLAGKTNRVTETGEVLLASLEAMQVPERLSRAHLLLARAAITASRWDAATEHLTLARRTGPASLLPSIDALAAQVAMGEGEPDRAAALARDALAGAERANLPEVACEALEVLGRAARLRDLELAAAAFQQAHDIAEAHSLTLWQIRALHELGTIDLLTAAPVDRLVAAHELAIQAGALATAAVIDLQTGAALLSQFDLGGSLAALRRSTDLARRFQLFPVLGMSLVLQAGALSFRGEDEAVDAAMDEALQLAGDVPDVEASVWGERGMLSLLGEHRTRARRELDRAMGIVKRSATTSPHPFRGLWALLRALDGEAEPVDEVRASGATVQRANSGFLSYAEALLLGREGRRAEAEAAVARGDAVLVPLPLYYHLARRVTAEGAIHGGWGSPVEWLREANIFFEEHGYRRAVTACRSLLRRAGVPVPRRGRGDAEVPDELRRLGVTSREMDVLLLLSEGLSNKEIGTRLYISPRTAERHVESLLLKTQSETRAKLVAFAARLTAPDAPSPSASA